MIATIIISTLVAIFITEVAMSMQGRESRPSAWLRYLVSRVRIFSRRAGAKIGALSDLITGARRLAGMLYSWIPLKVMGVALKDLAAPILDLLRAPIAFFEGLNQEIRTSALPFFTRFILTVQFANFLAAWQVIAMLSDWKLMRPSYMFLQAIYALMTGGYWMGYALISITDWSRIYRGVGRAAQVYILPWFPAGVFGEVYLELAASFDAARRIPLAFTRGAQIAFEASSNQALSILIVSLSIVAALLGLAYRYYYKRPDVNKKEDADIGAGVLM